MNAFIPEQIYLFGTLKKKTKNECPEGCILPNECIRSNILDFLKLIFIGFILKWS